MSKTKHFKNLEVEDDSLWVVCGVHEVHIKRTDEGTVVDIFAKRKRKTDDFGDVLASTYAFDND